MSTPTTVVVSELESVTFKLANGRTATVTFNGYSWVQDGDARIDPDVLDAMTGQLQMQGYLELSQSHGDFIVSADTDHLSDKHECDKCHDKMALTHEGQYAVCVNRHCERWMERFDEFDCRVEEE